MWKPNTLNNKNILVSGATSGIGRAVALAVARQGGRLVVCGRRSAELKKLEAELLQAGAAAVWAKPLDVRSQAAVAAWWEAVPVDFKPLAVLVNNAGLARGLSNIRDNDVQDWDEMIDTNIKGLLYMTRVSLPGMIQAAAGHVVNIGSLAGVAAYPKGAVYCATKAAVKVFADGLRQDLVDTPIRVTTIQPGMVETEFSVVRFHGDVDKAIAAYTGIQPLVAEDIAELVLFALQSPPHVQICELTVTPTHQATGGVVHRS
jgi:3-hydroxy acid dehydrogenase/malonic semialdehyde reductase